MFYDRYTENREEMGRALAKERGMSLIPSYDHPGVIAGQGTATKELLEATGQLDVLFVCLGGGGLLAGAALAARALCPRCRVIGVEPEAGNDGQQSFRAGRIIHIPVPRSIADGAIVTHLGEHNFPIIRKLVADIITVPDEMLVATMKFLADEACRRADGLPCCGGRVVSALSPAGRSRGYHAQRWQHRFTSIQRASSLTSIYLPSCANGLLLFAREDHRKSGVARARNEGGVGGVLGGCAR